MTDHQTLCIHNVPCILKEGLKLFVQNVQNDLDVWVKYETFLSMGRDHNAWLVIKLVPVNQKGVIMSKTVRLRDLKHLLWQLKLHKVTGTFVLPEGLFALLICKSFSVFIKDKGLISAGDNCSAWFLLRKHLWTLLSDCSAAVVQMGEDVSRLQLWPCTQSNN